MKHCEILYNIILYIRYTFVFMNKTKMFLAIIFSYCLFTSHFICFSLFYMVSGMKMIDVSELSQQYASNEPSITFQSCCKLKLWLFLCFGPPNAQIWKFGPDPQISDFFENYHCFRIVSSIHIQQALNDYQKLK